MTGSSVVLAVMCAALVATFNGLSSAQLAANHPVSGGTYEYGYRILGPAWGFTAGFMFLMAKSASAALGFAGYALHTVGIVDEATRVGVALGCVVALTLVVAGGLRQSSRANAMIVRVTLLALAAFVAGGCLRLGGQIDAFAQLRAHWRRRGHGEFLARDGVDVRGVYWVWPHRDAGMTGRSRPRARLCINEGMDSRRSR